MPYHSADDIKGIGVAGVRGAPTGITGAGFGGVGGRSGGDGLSLDLQFAADKTLTARRGPTPVLTRGTSATLVNSDGLIGYAPENLILQSENFGTTWVTANTTISANTEIAPNGTTTADTATVNNAGTNFLAQQVTVAASTQYTFSFYVKRGSATNATYSVFNNNANSDIVPATSYFSQTSSSNWVRVSFQFTTPVGCTSIFVYVLRNTGSTGSMHFWGAQLEIGPSVKSYNPTTTAAFYGPRFDHDPANPTICRGLLIEEGRTNLLVHSEDLTQTVWGRNGSTISANATTSPDGATTADGIVDDTTTLQHRVVQSFNAISGTTYTASCFIKRNQVTDFFQIGLASASFGSNNTWFNISNGTVVSSTGTASASTITAFPNGWYRVTHTVTCTTSNIAANAFLSPSTSSSTVNYTGTGVLTVYIWGAQLEAGSFATSYIPTTTSALARSADVCSITGANFTNLWNASEGTIFAAHYQYGATGFGAILTADREIDSGKVQIGRNGTTQGSVSIKDNANSVVFEYAPTSSLVSGRNKSSLAYKQNDSIATINNLSSALDTSVTLGTQTQLLIGSDSVAGGRRHNGAIDSIRVYKKRLSLAKLQALTA